MIDGVEALLPQNFLESSKSDKINSLHGTTAAAAKDPTEHPLARCVDIARGAVAALASSWPVDHDERHDPVRRCPPQQLPKGGRVSSPRPQSPVARLVATHVFGVQ